MTPPDGYEASGMTGSRRYMAPEVGKSFDGGMVVCSERTMHLLTHFSMCSVMQKLRAKRGRVLICNPILAGYGT